MECIHCKSKNIKALKIHITRPVGATKYKCFDCNKTFIATKPQNEITQSTKTNLQ